MSLPSLRFLPRSSVPARLRRLGLAASLLVGAIACAHQPAPSASADAEPEATASVDPEPSPDAPTAYPDDQPEPNCPIRYEGTCFDTKIDACARAGCPLEACSLAKSLPAKVECNEQWPTDGG